MSARTDSEGRPYLESVGVGVGAWIISYVFTYLLVATDIESSPLNQLIEFFGGESATHELVGWVFYNAHFVDISYTGIGLLSPPGSFIGGDGFTPLLHVIPPALLFIAGLALGRYAGVTELDQGAITGALVVPGYLLASLIGVFVFTVDIGDASGAPEFASAVLIAGVVYPVVFGALGGVIAAATADTAE
jgi:hypothetical protein